MPHGSDKQELWPNYPIAQYSNDSSEELMTYSELYKISEYPRPTQRKYGKACYGLVYYILIIYHVTVIAREEGNGLCIHLGKVY